MEGNVTKKELENRISLCKGIIRRYQDALIVIEEVATRTEEIAKLIDSILERMEIFIREEDMLVRQVYLMGVKEREAKMGGIKRYELYLKTDGHREVFNKLSDAQFMAENMGFYVHEPVQKKDDIVFLLYPNEDVVEADLDDDYILGSIKEVTW